jgi:hypothetical protein
VFRSLSDFYYKTNKSQQTSKQQQAGNKQTNKQAATDSEVGQIKGGSLSNTHQWATNTYISNTSSLFFLSTIYFECPLVLRI